MNGLIGLVLAVTILAVLRAPRQSAVVMGFMLVLFRGGPWWALLVAPIAAVCLAPDPLRAVHWMVAAVGAIVASRPGGGQCTAPRPDCGETISADDLNARLAALYRDHWPRIWVLTASLPGCSKPLYVRVPSAYARSKRKLVVVGQQTNGWDMRLPPGRADRAVSDLMELYAEFDLGHSYRTTPFWRITHRLYSAVCPGGAPGGFVWTNLLRVDISKGRPRSIEAALCGDDLLLRELAILQPDVVVFLVGPDYRQPLASTFAGAEFQLIAGMPAKLLARVVHPSLPLHSYHTYHPGYLVRARLADTVLRALALQVRA